MSRTDLTNLKVLALEDDIACLAEKFDHPAAPSQAYVVMPPISGILFRSAIYRRHGFFPYEACLTTEGLARLMVDLSRHEDGQALALTAGEFFGLQVNAWRHSRGSPYPAAPPMSHWMYLQCLAFYKVERARRAKKRDEAQRLLALYRALRERFRPESALAYREIMGETLY